MTNPTPNTTEPFRRRLAMLRMIHLAMVMGSLMFGALMMLMLKERAAPGDVTQNPMMAVAAISAVLSIGLATAMKNIVRKRGAQAAGTGDGFAKYATFILVRASILEGGGLFSAVCSLLTNHKLPLAFFALCIVALACFRPSQQEFTEIFDPRSV